MKNLDEFLRENHMKLFPFRLAQILCKMSLFCLTFFIGLTGIFLWFQLSLPTLALCEIAKNPKQYQGKTVRIVTSAQTNHGIFFFRDESCDFGGWDAAISLPEDYKPTDEQIQNFLSEKNEKYLSAQMIIIGEIDTTVEFQDYSPLFVIKAREVELTSKVKIEAEKSVPNIGNRSILLPH